MQDQNELRIRLDAAGEPDLDYYLGKAHEVRSQAIAAGLRNLKNRMTRAIAQAWSSPEGQKVTRQRVVQSGWPWVDLILDTHQTRRAGHA